MLAVEVELLGGAYRASAHDDRTRAEWPPHPARLFSAMVAAANLHGEMPAEDRAALTWLEQQGAPGLRVDASDRVGQREVKDVFVPINDVTMVGDLEADVRRAQAELDVLVAAAMPPEKTDQKQLTKDRRDAQKSVEKERLKVEAAIAKLQRVDDEPTASDVQRARALLPDSRTRQMRTFPVAIPEHPRVVFCWPEAPSDAIRGALDRLLERVTSLGHSSSLVRCALTTTTEPTLVPNDGGAVVLRVVGPGQLEALTRAHERHLGIDNRILPALRQRYDAARASDLSQRPATVWAPSDWVTFACTDRVKLAATAGVSLARALRAALIERADGDLPELLSGHAATGGPSERPHLAFIALPFVGRAHADGLIHGLALVLPRELTSGERQRLVRLVAELELRSPDRSIELRTGNVRARIARVDASDKLTLTSAMWTNPSRAWATVTPIALDKNPGQLHSILRSAGDAARQQRAYMDASTTVARAAQRVGLPLPESVELSLTPTLEGVRDARDFASYPGVPGRTTRVLVHARLSFATAVRGPIILGAGRYHGLGLCQPVASYEEPS